ncbi:MAG TPA: hypothetical protein VNU97_09805 [Rhizomicrobium sp.]|jgi:hypothetical protein|nr:hypothetical protein [Rhizomicrobium sp.]
MHDEGDGRKTVAFVVSALSWSLAWAWTLVAGGSGLWLLVTRGPWPPTNGWFALASGLCACPLTAWLAKRFAGVALSGYLRLAAAAFFFLAGHLALLVWPHA